MDLESIVQRSQRMPSADSASKVLHHMQRSEKMLRAGHGLSVDLSIQRRLATTPAPITLYSDPSFSLFKLADKRPLPEPRGALFDICTENFHYALPVDAVLSPLAKEDLGELLTAPAAAATAPPAHPTVPSAAAAAPQTDAAPPETQEKPLKQKEKKEKKEKEKKEKKDKKEKRDKKDKREKGDKKEKKDKKRKRSAEAPECAGP